MDIILIIVNFLFAVAMPFSHIAGYLSGLIIFLFIWMFWNEIKSEKIFWWFAGFVIYMLLINLFSNQPKVGLGPIAGYATHWILPFLVGYSLKNKQWTKKVFWTYYIVFGTIVFFSILAYLGLFFKSFGDSYLLVSEGLLKGFRSHIALGGLCLLSAFLSLSQVIVRKDLSNRGKLLFSGLTVFFLIAVLLTGSRGYYIATFLSFLGLGIFLTIQTKSFKLLFIGVIGFVVLFGVFYFTIPAINERINRISSSDNSIKERFALYSVAIKEIKDRPLFGFGPGQGILQSKYFDELPQELRNVIRHPRLHNFYLNFLADFGIVGFVFLIAIFYLIIKKLLFISLLGNGFIKTLSFGLLLGIFGILIGDMLDTLLGGPGVAMELFWLTGLVFRQHKEMVKN